MSSEVLQFTAEALQKHAGRCRQIAASTTNPVARAELEEASRKWTELALRQGDLRVPYLHNVERKTAVRNELALLQDVLADYRARLKPTQPELQQSHFEVADQERPNENFEPVQNDGYQRVPRILLGLVSAAWVKIRVLPQTARGIVEQRRTRRFLLSYAKAGWEGRPLREGSGSGSGEPSRKWMAYCSGGALREAGFGPPKRVLAVRRRLRLFSSSLRGFQVTIQPELDFTTLAAAFEYVAERGEWKLVRLKRQDVTWSKRLQSWLRRQFWF